MQFWRTIRIGASALTLMCAGGPVFAQSPSITNLGVLPGGAASYANGVSADGLAVAGTSGSADGDRAFRWTAAGGMQNLGTLPGALHSLGFAISGDGSAVVGRSGGYPCIDELCWTPSDVSIRWTAGLGMQMLGPQFNPGPGNSAAAWASGISFDGSSAAIGTTQGSDTNIYTAAYRWTAGAGLQVVAWDNWWLIPSYSIPSSAANAISYDGSVVAGRTHLSAFRWTQGDGIEDLGVLPGASDSWGVAITGDGSAVAGYCSPDSYGTIGHRAFRWMQAGGMQDLGVLSPGGSSAARAISGDGSVVAGADWYTAFLWTSDLGIVDLNKHLPSLGLDLTGWVLTDARGLNFDGSVIVGNGYYNGEARGWMVRIPRPGDIIGDGDVNIDDLLAVISAWGPCPAPSNSGSCLADIYPPPSGDGQVNVDDLLRVINNWG
jgi:probable HAF family extracellular repeat protein